MLKLKRLFHDPVNLRVANESFITPIKVSHCLLGLVEHAIPINIVHSGHGR